MFKNRNFMLVSLVNVVSWISLYMLNTTIVPYAVELGVTASLAGVVSGLYFAASFVTRPFSGVLGDRFSRKNLFLISSVLLAAAGVGLLCVRSVGLLLALRVVQGVGYSVSTTTAMALAADTLREDQIGPGIGYFGLTTVVGQMVGPALALAVVDRWGFPAMLALSLLLRAAALVMTVFLPDAGVRARAPAQAPGQWSVWRILERSSLLPAGVGMLFSMLNSAISAFLVIHAQAYGIPGSGLFFTVSTLAMFLTRSLCSRYTDRRSLASTALVSGLFCIGTMLLLGLGRTQATLLLAGAVFGVGYGALLPVTQARSVQRPPPERRSLGSSTYYIGIDLGFSLSNLVCGRLVETAGSGRMYLFLILPALGAMALALWKGRDAPK